MNKILEPIQIFKFKIKITKFVIFKKNQVFTIYFNLSIKYVICKTNEQNFNKIYKAHLLIIHNNCAKFHWPLTNTFIVFDFIKILQKKWVF